MKKRIDTVGDQTSQAKHFQISDNRKMQGKRRREKFPLGHFVTRARHGTTGT